MPRYLCLQRPLPGGTGERLPPALMQALAGRFNAWRETFQKNLVDPGGKLGASRLVAPEPGPAEPVAEVRQLVGGYMIVDAPDVETAMRIARECPGLVQEGSGVEVIEIRGS